MFVAQGRDTLDRLSRRPMLNLGEKVAPIAPEGRAPGIQERIARVSRRAWSPIRDGTGQKGRCWGASPSSRKGESQRRKDMGLGLLTAGRLGQGGEEARRVAAGAALTLLAGRGRAAPQDGGRAGRCGPSGGPQTGILLTSPGGTSALRPAAKHTSAAEPALDAPPFAFLIDRANGGSAVAVRPPRPSLRPFVRFGSRK